MATKNSREKIRIEYLNKLINFFNEEGEEVLRVKSNEIALPVVTENGDEEFVVFTVRVPTGSTKDKEPYDAYNIAESYKIDCKVKEEKKADRERKKNEKIERDKIMREKKKENKEKREGG